MATIASASAYFNGFFSTSVAEPLVLHTGNQIITQLASNSPKNGTIEFVDNPNFSGTPNTSAYYKENFDCRDRIGKVWEEQQYADDDSKVIGVFNFERERFKTHEKRSQMLPYLENENSFIRQAIAYASIVSEKSFLWGKPTLIGNEEVYRKAFAQDKVAVLWNFPDKILDEKDDPFDELETKERQTIYSGEHIAVLLDRTPITDLHFLFFTHASRRNFFETTDEERLEAMELKEKLKAHYFHKMEDPILTSLTATNTSGGQSVKRYHEHVIFVDGLEQEKAGQKNSGWKMIGRLPALSNGEMIARVKILKDELLPVFKGPN